MNDSNPGISSLCVGQVTHDRSGDRIVAGGCAYYAARVFQALGAHSRLVTAVGEDFACAHALDGLEWAGERQGTTTVFTNTYPDVGTRVQYVERQAGTVCPDVLPDSWAQVDVAFLGPVIGELTVAAWRRALRARFFAIGVQGFVREAVQASKDCLGSRRVVPKKWMPDPDALRQSDIAFLSEEDLEGQGNLLERLKEQVGLVALTREQKGCDLIEGDKQTWVGIHPAKVVDPTGAGDTFAAGMLFGLARGDNPVDAAKLGAAAASIIIEGKAGENFKKLGEAFERARRVR